MGQLNSNSPVSMGQSVPSQSHKEEKCVKAQTIRKHYDSGGRINLEGVNEEVEAFSTPVTDSMSEVVDFDAWEAVEPIKEVAVKENSVDSFSVEEEEEKSDLVEEIQQLNETNQEKRKRILDQHSQHIQLQKDIEDILSASGVDEENEEEQEEQNKPEPNANEKAKKIEEEELSVFDKLEKARSKSTTYDLGTIDLSSKFDAFDSQLDKEEQESSARAMEYQQKLNKMVTEDAEVIDESVRAEAMQNGDEWLSSTKKKNSYSSLSSSKQREIKRTFKDEVVENALKLVGYAALEGKHKTRDKSKKFQIDCSKAFSLALIDSAHEMELPICLPSSATKGGSARSYLRYRDYATIGEYKEVVLRYVDPTDFYATGKEIDVNEIEPGDFIHYPKENFWNSDGSYGATGHIMTIVGVGKDSGGNVTHIEVTEGHQKPKKVTRARYTVDEVITMWDDRISRHGNELGATRVYFKELNFDRVINSGSNYADKRLKIKDAYAKAYYKDHKLAINND